MAGFFMAAYNKQPKTFADQLALLKQRGLVVADDAVVLQALQHCNYYRLRAYWLPFEVTPPPAQGQHAFVPGTTLETVLVHYEFDRKLRALVLDALERVEVSFRTSWAYNIAHAAGAHGHLEQRLYRDAQRHASDCAALMTTVNDSKETFVRHYLRTYNTPAHPPIWAACEILTFGELSRWYDNLNEPTIRIAIAQQFGLHEVVFTSVIHHLSYVRNVCAHHSRLWNRAMTIKMQLPRSPGVLWGSLEPAMPDRLYNTLAVLAFLVDRISPGCGWKQRLIDHVNANPGINLRAMGFPLAWTARAIWR